MGVSGYVLRTAVRRATARTLLRRLLKRDSERLVGDGLRCRGPQDRRINPSAYGRVGACKHVLYGADDHPRDADSIVAGKVSGRVRADEPVHGRVAFRMIHDR